MGIELFGEVKNWQNKIIRVEIIKRISPEASELLDRMSDAGCLPGAAYQTAIIDLIDSLIGSGVWENTEALYILTAECEEASKLNWKEDANNLSDTTNPTWLGSWTGWSGDASHYLDSGIPLNATSLMTPLDSHVWGYGLQDELSLGYYEYFGLARRPILSVEHHDFFVAGGNHSISETSYHPFLCGVRNGSSTLINAYYAGSGSPDFKSSEGLASNLKAMPADTFKLLSAINPLSGGGGNISQQLLGSGFGKALTGTQVESFYNALKIFYNEVMV